MERYIVLDEKNTLCVTVYEFSKKHFPRLTSTDPAFDQLIEVLWTEMGVGLVLDDDRSSGQRLYYDPYVQDPETWAWFLLKNPQ